MHIAKFEKDTIVIAAPKTYLKIKDVENSEEIIGKPHRIFLSNEGIIPEFEEIPFNMIEEEEKPVKKRSSKK